MIEHLLEGRHSRGLRLQDSPERLKSNQTHVLGMELWFQMLSFAAFLFDKKNGATASCTLMLHLREWR